MLTFELFYVVTVLAASQPELVDPIVALVRRYQGPACHVGEHVCVPNFVDQVLECADADRQCRQVGKHYVPKGYLPLVLPSADLVALCLLSAPPLFVKECLTPGGEFFGGFVPLAGVQCRQPTLVEVREEVHYRRICLEIGAGYRHLRVSCHRLCRHTSRLAGRLIAWLRRAQSTAFTGVEAMLSTAGMRARDMVLMLAPTTPRFLGVVMSSISPGPFTTRSAAGAKTIAASTRRMVMVYCFTVTPYRPAALDCTNKPQDNLFYTSTLGVLPGFAGRDNKTVGIDRIYNSIGRLGVHRSFEQMYNCDDRFVSREFR